MQWRDVLLHNYAEPTLRNHPTGVIVAVVTSLLACAACAACCIVQRRKVRVALRTAQAAATEIQIASEIRSAKGTVEGAALTKEGNQDDTTVEMGIPVAAA